jgi:hypothetical protein
MREKNPLIKWGKKNQDDKFMIRKIDYNEEISRIERE